MKKSYYYANAQILAQREHTDPADPDVYDEYFFVHDRLGSVRMVVAYNGTDTVNTANSYSYTPFGAFYECDETVNNPWTFTGQWYDAEIGQYYLRARMYDPQLMRFTGRDPVPGNFKKPLTVHKYLYCLNDPTDRTDPSGRIPTGAISAITTGAALYGHGINLAAYGASSGNWDFIELGVKTMQFMPVAMTIAAAHGGSFSINSLTFKRLLKGVGINVGTGLTVDFLNPTGMGVLEELAMDPLAFATYGAYAYKFQDYMGISREDMHDFRDWRGFW